MKRVLVTGLPRSCTSVVASMVDALGFPLPRDCRGPGVRTRGGYLEHDGWVRIVQSAFQDYWGHWPYYLYAPDWCNKKLPRFFREQDEAHPDGWCIKDCYSVVLPHIRALFDHVILTVRNPEENAAARRAFSSEPVHPALETPHMLEQLWRCIFISSSITVHVESLRQDALAEARHLAACLEAPGSPDEAARIFDRKKQCHARDDSVRHGPPHA